jgi:hypothetical protein
MTLPMVLHTLPATTQARLRHMAQTGDDVAWPRAVARVHGQPLADGQHQAQQRAQGQREMAALVAATGLGPSLAPPQVRALLLAAVRLYLQTGPTAATAYDDPTEEDVLRLSTSRCPVYACGDAADAVGAVACGCLARLRGWEDALGVRIGPALALNRRWGDPACELTIHLPTAAAEVEPG